MSNITASRKQREDMNLKNLLNDANHNWDLSNLCRRYRSFSREAIIKILKNNGIEINYGVHWTAKMHKEAVASLGSNIPDMLDATYTIYPTHQRARMI